MEYREREKNYMILYQEGSYLIVRTRVYIRNLVCQNFYYEFLVCRSLIKINMRYFNDFLCDIFVYQLVIKGKKQLEQIKVFKNGILICVSNLLELV